MNIYQLMVRFLSVLTTLSILAHAIQKMEISRVKIAFYPGLIIRFEFLTYFNSFERAEYYGAFIFLIPEGGDCFF